MKKIALILISFLLLGACSKETNNQPVSSTEQKDGFKVTLYTDKAVYHKDEKINVWATFEYVGEKDNLTIWSGDPYLTFTINDDNREFSTGGMFLTILKPTTIKRNIVYKHEYQKTGGWSESDPKADFWREFYSEPDLYLPVGDYTVRAVADFSLDDEVKERFNVSTELKIRVVD